MSQRKSAKIQHHFAKLSDPRRRKVTYPLINIVVIAVCAVICGADDFVAIADFGKVNVRRYQTEEKGHGRKETRYYFVSAVPDDLPDGSRWPQV
jgi:hypothetical protein